MSLARTSPPAPLAADRSVASATIPRGRSGADPDAAPAVAEHVWLLHVQYARTRDTEVLSELVDEYSSYALLLARRLHRHAEPLEDLQQVALESLVACLQRFDPERSVPFVAYATPTIIGSLKRHFRDQGWALRVPRVAHDLAGPAREAADRLTGVLGRPPTVAEVAADLSVSEEDLLLAQSATKARSLVSLDAPRRAGDEGDGTFEIGDVDESFALAEGRAALDAAIHLLGPKERTVLGLYFFERLTQREIAARFGVSQMQVSRWISSSLSRLRSQMDSEETADRSPSNPAPGLVRRTA